MTIYFKWLLKQKNFMDIKSYLNLFAGMVMLELGNLSSTLAPFNVGVISEGFSASSQESGLVVSLELFFAAIGALIFGASNKKGRGLAFVGSMIVISCYYLGSLSTDILEIYIIKSLAGIGLQKHFESINTLEPYMSLSLKFSRLTGILFVIGFLIPL